MLRNSYFSYGNWFNLDNSVLKYNVQTAIFNFLIYIEVYLN